MAGQNTLSASYQVAYAQSEQPPAAGGTTIFLPLIANRSGGQAISVQATPEKLLALQLQQLDEILRTIAGQVTTGSLSAIDRHPLQAVRTVLVDLDPQIEAAFAARAAKLLEAGLPAEIGARHQASVESYQQQRQQLLDQIDQVLVATDTATLRVAVTALQQTLAPSIPQPASIIPADERLDAKVLAVEAPVRDLREAGFEVASAAIQAGLAVPGRPPVAADLAPTIDVQLTPAIVELAASLDHSPLQIYEYVKNHIAYEPYLGSRKGAQETLLAGAGNDYDQASLLIALLRASNIPARYVAGTVLLPATQALNWLGVEHLSAAANLLAMAGLQATIYTGPNGQALGFKHVWVAAYVPYANYRGAPHDESGKLWLPLDPSLKVLTIRPGVDVPAAMDFNAAAFVDSYISTFHALSPLELYLQQIEQYAASAYPTLNYPRDIIRQRVIAPTTLALLPSSLPYRVLSQEADYWEIPADKRYRIRFQVLDDTQATLLDYTADLPAIAGRRTTLSYEAATPADQAVINAYGDLYATPPNLIYLKPVLRINGVAVAQGGRIRAGLAHSTKRYYLKPAGDLLGNSSTTHSIFAGEYQGIAFDTFRARLGAVTDTTNPITPDPDGVLGAELYRTAMAYQDRLSQSWELAADTMQVVYATSVAQAVVTNRLQVYNNLSGVPVVWEPQGPTVDAQNKTVGGAYSVSSGASELNQFLILVGADGSILENRVFEDLYDQEAISTIKVLALANDADIPICVLTASNLGDCSIMYQSQSLINLINLALTLGYEVVAPKNSLTYHDWHGGGFIARHPVTKVGVWYIIESGLNGGATVDNLASWYITWSWVFRWFDAPLCTDEPPFATEVIAPAANSYWPAQKSWWQYVPFDFHQPWNIRNLRPAILYQKTFCYDNDGVKTYVDRNYLKIPTFPYPPGDHSPPIDGLAEPFQFTIFDVRINTPDGPYAPKNGESIQLDAHVIPRMPPDGEIIWTKSGAGDGNYSHQVTETITFSGTATGDMMVGATITNPNGSVSDEQALTVFGVEILDSTTTFMGKGYDAPVVAPPTPAQVFYYIDAFNHPDLGLFIARAMTMTISQGAVLTHTALLSMSLPGNRNTTWDGTNLNHQFVPAGVYQARLAVAAPNGKQAVSAPYPITVVEVTNVEFFDMSGNAIACPPAPAAPTPACNQHPTHAGGVRIFPDSPAPGQPRNNKVKVRATLSAVVPLNALPVYFNSYDVNDPTGLLNDNHADSIESIPVYGRINDTTSDGDNIVEVEFRMTMQPGDNFKVLASTNQVFLDSLDDATVEASINITTGTTTDLVLQPLSSERLTVWRLLHMEVDSMGPVAGNQIVGSITSVMTTVVTSTVTTDQNFFEPDSPITVTHRFENGILIDNNSTRFDVITNTHGNNLSLIVNNNGGVMPVVGPFTLVDDDDFNSNDVGNLDGDAGEDINDPDTSMVMNSDLITENIFAQVYIRPIRDIGGADVPFTLNAPPNNAFTSIFDFDNAATKDSADFWTIYLVGAYQYSTDVDSDPNPVPGVSRIHGVADAGRTGAALFKATNSETRRATCQEPIIVAHEIGHLFGISGNPHPARGDIMEEDCGAIGISLHPDTQISIRDQEAP